MKLFIGFLLCAPFAVYSQQSPSKFPENKKQFQGIVVDRENKQPLAYTNIGILNRPVGTVSDSSGRFTLSVANEYLDDTLQFSMVGYYPVKRPVREFIKGNESLIIPLLKKINQLKEVVITHNLQHIEIVGRQSKGSFLQASIVPKGGKNPIIGAESGLRIQAKRYPAQLENFNFYVSGNNFKYIKFRLNIYSLKNNLPDTLLFNHEILVGLNNFKTGWSKIDLTPYKLTVGDDFAITLQWVDYDKEMVEEPKILVPISVSFSHLSYFRTTAQNKWNSARGNSSVFVTLRD
jgi:hypothetical protein